jgi:hydrogenase maturation protein HypF
MLPSTPLHYLLLREVGDIPVVMTSGNRSDEPIAYHDDDALRRLAGIADLYLTHNRPIHLRCDDSVTRLLPDGSGELPIRRSRGYAPAPIPLPVACARPILAVGGQLKNTFALGRGRHALLGHHIGDLEHYEAYRSFTEAVPYYEQLFGIRPEWIAHDLHPDYASTRYALEQTGVQRLAVQHHHAHLAACLAEHGLLGPALGVIFDGTGFGTDGAIWGGEFLVGGLRDFRRAAHLRYVPLPGGEQAIREPWRMALAHLLDAGEDPDLLDGAAPASARQAVRQLLARRLHALLTSGAGRLFDAVAALAGVRTRVSYEGQAAIDLEARAVGAPPFGEYPFALEPADSGPMVIDTRPLIAAVAGDVRRQVPSPIISRRFHSTMVEMIASVCARLRDQTGLDVVALSGGVFQNVLLTTEVTSRLTTAGFRVYRHRQVPANDGGLCLGQLAVAACAVP